MSKETWIEAEELARVDLGREPTDIEIQKYFAMLMGNLIEEASSRIDLQNSPPK